MKFLVFSDSHSKESEKLYSFLENNNDIDLVIITGDITDFGPLDFVNDFIGNILKFEVDVIAIPGNCDESGICNAINDSGAFCLHNQIMNYGNAILFGYGGSNETPFNTPGEIPDNKIYGNLHQLFAEFNYIYNENSSKVKILVTHAPPYNTKADLIECGDHVGSSGIQKVIQEFQPDLNLCGHIHEAKSVDFIGKTKIINPGMLENGSAVLIDIDSGANFSAKIIEL